MAAMALKLSCDTNDLTARVKRNRMQCKPGPSGVCLVFFRFLENIFCSVRFPSYLQFGAGNCHFKGVCNIWKSNLSFSMVFATFWCSNCSCCMVFCNESTLRVGLGFIYGWLAVGFWFEILRLVKTLFHVGLGFI
jgi:TRAP-type C4-dicarboxylate transport system permease small subunit